MSDVDMPERVRMGSKSEIFRVFLKKFTETCFVAHYYACKFSVSRLRIDGDIRQKAAITAIMENVVIAIYRLRPIQ